MIENKRKTVNKRKTMNKQKTVNKGDREQERYSEQGKQNTSDS